MSLSVMTSANWVYLFSFLILNRLLPILDLSYKWKKEDSRRSSSYPPALGLRKKGNKKERQQTRGVGGGALSNKMSHYVKGLHHGCLAHFVYDANYTL